MIHLHQLHFGYGRKKKPLFEGLDLELSAGNIYGLLGRNGAGKTSLLKIMSGLLFPKSGTCTIMEHTPAHRTPRFLQELFFVPEEFFLPALSANTYAKRYASFYPRFDAERFQHYLHEFQLDPNTKMTGMSYGQKKKVLLSFALATNCRLLIFDEPTNGLDIPSKSQFRKLIAGSIDEDQTYLISTHQVRDLGNLLDPIIILDRGTILFQESLEHIGKRLTFEPVLQAREPEGVLHAERVPGGYMTVSENRHGIESEVDLEVLFNAIILHPEQIKGLFATEAVS